MTRRLRDQQQRRPNVRVSAAERLLVPCRRESLHQQLECGNQGASSVPGAKARTLPSPISCPQALHDPQWEPAHLRTCLPKAITPSSHSVCRISDHWQHSVTFRHGIGGGRGRPACLCGGLSIKGVPMPRSLAVRHEKGPWDRPVST